MRGLLLLSGLFLLTASCGGGGGIAKPDVHYRDFGINVAKRSAPYLTRENHKEGWGESDCLGCHQGFKHTMATPDTGSDKYQALIDNAVERVGRNNSVLVCSACHGTNGAKETGTGKSVERKCLICHDGFDRLHFYRGTSQRNNFHDFNGNGRIDDFDCVVCHWQPDMDGIVEPETDFGMVGGGLKENSQKLCLTCHSNSWDGVKGSPVADTDGNGEADRKISPLEEPPNVGISWGGDWHGEGSFTSGDRPFKGIDLSGELLFHTNHSSLECVNCHNPHSSRNSKLIVERVGETLTVVKAVRQVDNEEVVKYALIDPQTVSYFDGLSYGGVVVGRERSYDLSKAEDLEEYLKLPVENDDSSVEANRETVPSLCASCHGGSADYSPINGLGLSVDLKNHNSGKACVSCHSHARGTF